MMKKYTVTVQLVTRRATAGPKGVQKLEAHVTPRNDLAFQVEAGRIAQACKRARVRLQELLPEGAVVTGVSQLAGVEAALVASYEASRPKAVSAQPLTRRPRK
jgi:hypothetical protein